MTQPIRMAHKMMADSRAMEEQNERENPLEGSGATPSMGLSQIRGGAMAHGKALSEHLHSLHGAAYTKDFCKGMNGGLGTGRYEGQGHMEGGWLGLAAMALPLLGKLLGAGKMSKEAHDMMAKMIKKHEKKYHSGKMEGGWLGLAALALPLLGKLLGAGEMTKGAHDQLKKMMKNHSSGMEGSGRCVGAGTGGRMVPVPYGRPQKPVMELMEGRGKESESDEEEAPMVAKKAKKVKRAVGAEDGRRKRAEVVRKVMKEKGMKMIEASKYVKEHGLY